MFDFEDDGSVWAEGSFPYARRPKRPRQPPKRGGPEKPRKRIPKDRSKIQAKRRIKQLEKEIAALEKKLEGAIKAQNRAVDDFNAKKALMARYKCFADWERTRS